MLLALSVPALAGLLVNEVLYDAASTDAGNEWVELCNNGASAVDLTGYEVQSGGTAWTESYTFASGTIDPGEYLLVGLGSSEFPATFAPELANGGDESDGVRLVDASGATIDTLLYDAPGATLVDDLGNIPATAGPDVGSGHSVGRWPDCTDSNDSAIDFVDYAAASTTPGAANVEGDADTDTDTDTDVDTADCSAGTTIKINELVYATGVEWIELYNAGSTAAVLDGWVLSYGTRPTSTQEFALPASTTLAAGGFLVVGSSGAPYADISEDLGDLGNASNTDGLLLQCGGTTLDTLLYADGNDDGWTDDSGAVATSFAPKPGSTESIRRIQDGVDTDQCGVDFDNWVPTPGLTNEEYPPGDADCTGSDALVINELDYTTGAEWVELYNGGASPVNLDAWTLEFGTSDYSHIVTLEAGAVVPPGGWFVIGSDGAAVKDVSYDLEDIGNASNSDSLRIVCNYAPIDTVVYGSGNEDAWLDDTGAVATSIAPKPGSGETIARVEDGYDTDQCGADFVASAEPTPGGANPVVVPPVCDTTGGEDIKINEFIYNAEGTDTDAEWVELYNNGDVAVRLDAWVIEAAIDEWGAEYTFPGGVTLEPGDFVVVGGENVDEIDYLADGMSIPNASSFANGLRLTDCEGTVLDSVLYGGDLGSAISGDDGSIEIVPDTTDGFSLGRYGDGEDTNEAVNWHPYADPTPGGPNSDPGGTGPGDDDDDDGCGSNNPPKPGQGCTTVLPFGGMEVGLAALALFRRRRR
jgi:hypothetical protein